MTPHNYEIVDCGAFCAVIFSASRPIICLGTFSKVSPVLFRSVWTSSMRCFEWQSAIMDVHNNDVEKLQTRSATSHF